MINMLFIPQSKANELMTGIWIFSSSGNLSGSQNKSIDVSFVMSCTQCLRLGSGLGGA